MFGKLLCVAALASAALAQDISIVLPRAGTKVAAGSAFTIQLQRPTPPTATEEVAIAIGGSPCLAGCFQNDLGSPLYTGPFNPQWTNGAGNAYQNFTLTAPNWFEGTMQLSVAHFYLSGLTANALTAELQLTSTTLTIVGATG